MAGGEAELDYSLQAYFVDIAQGKLMRTNSLALDEIVHALPLHMLSVQLANLAARL